MRRYWIGLLGLALLGLLGLASPSVPGRAAAMLPARRGAGPTTSCATPSFSPAASFAVGTRPFGVATGDFNADGHPDLVAANSSSNTVSVRLGDGLGGFGGATSYAAGSVPVAVAVADFNQDSKLDLAVADYQNNILSVLLGNGDGTFAAPSPNSVGLTPRAVVVGDFNHDNNLDLITANYLTNPGNVSVLLGNGNGTFAAATTVVIGVHPYALAVADFNPDNNLDLAVADYDANRVRVLLGNGTGGFGAVSSFVPGTGPIGLTVADLNQDGNLDLAVANYVSNNVSVLLGNGTGGFGTATNYPTGTLADAVVAGDFNGDGFSDLAVANYNASNTAVLLGDGLGGVGTATIFAVGTQPIGIAVDDFNQDSKPDLVTANYGANNLSVLLNRCGVSASPTPTTGSNATPTATPTSLPSTTPTATPSSTPLPCGPAWRIEPSPNQPAADNYLWALAVLAPNDIWAVGQYRSSTDRTLIEHWDGSVWSVVPSPNQGNAQNTLQDVAAVAPNDIWAVGDYYNTASVTYQTLIEHWNGIQWSIVPSANTSPARYHFLDAVAAVAADDVWAVGHYEMGNTIVALTEHWDGTTWAIVPSPNPGISGSDLLGVAGLAANDVWIVGDTTTSTSTLTLTEHWDGTNWSIVSSPSPGTQVNYLRGLAAVAGDDVWAVGHSYSSGVADQTLIEHWDGTSWNTVPSLDPGTIDNYLDAVTVRGANDVWAVGHIANSSTNETLIEHWDGTSWSVVPSPSPNNSTLYGVAAVTATDVWVVGYYNFHQTLVEHYTDPCLPTPSPTPTTTPTVLVTPTPTSSPTPTPTPPVGGPTATPCPVAFTDVPSGSTFYNYIRCLACRGIVGGYPCGGPGEPCPGPYFRPNNNVTRGQTAKIVASAANLNEPVPSAQQTFADVPPSSTFWLWIERLAGRGIIGGYPCGGAFESCVAPTNRPYFRPNNNVTRGQLSKIVSLAAHWTETPTGQTFEDVTAGNTFYLYVERVAGRGIVGGYPCGGASEPCVAPTNRPYFRPNNNATRGQMSKIAAQAFFPNCQTPAH